MSTVYNTIARYINSEFIKIIDTLTLLVGVGAVAAASAAVPALAPAAPATVGPARFRASNPPGHRHGGRSGGLRLPGDDAVDSPAAGGRHPADQSASLVLDEACDVLVCGGRQVDRVALLPDTQPSRACLGCQFLSSPKGRHWVEGVERQPKLLSLTGNDIAVGARGAHQDVLFLKRARCLVSTRKKHLTVLPHRIPKLSTRLNEAMSGILL